MFPGAPFVGLNVIIEGLVNLVSDLFFSTSYTSMDPVNPVASCTITVKRNGTWTVTVGAGDFLTGSASGTWAAVPSATVGDGATVKYTSSNLVNSPNITNNASTDTALTADRTFVVSKGVGQSASCDVEILVKMGAEQVSDNANIYVEGTTGG